jgi:hypothetical protein
MATYTLIFSIVEMKSKYKDFIFFFIFGVLTPLSAIFQLYHGDQF